MAYFSWNLDIVDYIMNVSCMLVSGSEWAEESQ